MAAIPDAVARRLAELADLSISIQNPNFNHEELDYHEPDLGVGQSGALEGSWSHHGVEYEFGLVGQVSAHQTFIGDYGDMFYRNNNAATCTSADILRAKWKLSVAVPHGESDDGPMRTLRKQFEALKAIEESNFVETAKSAEGVIKTVGFAHCTDTQWRTSAFSDNIFHSVEDPDETYVPFEPFDGKGKVAALHSDKRKHIVVRPVDFVFADMEDVPRDKIQTVFRPGAWVEMSCKLRVWYSSAKEKAGQARRPAARSYQVIFDAVQHLADGRIKEGPLKTAPQKPSTKRKFRAVSSSSPASPQKKVCFGTADTLEL